jgi:hypothetical protein
MMTTFFEPLHNFLIGPLVVKLRKEAEDLRIFNHADMCATAYLLTNKFVGSMPGWNVRCQPRFGVRNPDIVIFQNYEVRAVCQFVFGLTTEKTSHLPVPEIEDNIGWLKEVLDQRAPKGAGRGYILALFDYDQRWFVPQAQEKHNIYIASVNCQDIPLHHVWRPKWDEAKKRLF